MGLFAPLGSRPRKRAKKPDKVCMTPGCARMIPRWQWLCGGCFRQLSFARRKAIAEACQAREPARVFGLCRDAAEWLVEQREKRVDG